MVFQAVNEKSICGKMPSSRQQIEEDFKGVNESSRIKFDIICIRLFIFMIVYIYLCSLRILKCYSCSFKLNELVRLS